MTVPGLEDLAADEQIHPLAETQMIALIAYIQKLGAFDPVEPKKRERRIIGTPDLNHQAK